jgi:acyl-CoA synthetase (AMP-forming)/AMP-acid ligase II
VVRAGAGQLPPAGGVDLERTALVFDGRRRSHRELREHAGRVAAGLAGLGVKAGDPVGVLSGNCLEYLEVEAGIGLAGAVPVQLDPRLPPAAIAALLSRCGAQAVFVEGPLLSALGTLRRSGEMPRLRTIVALGAGPGDLDYEELCSVAARGEVEDLGSPSAVDLDLTRDLQLDADCSTYVVADLVLSGRDVLVWPLLAVGGEVHLRRSGPFAARPVLDYIGEHRITHVAWTPAMLRATLATSALTAPGERRLRGVVCVGGGFADGLVAEARRALPTTTVLRVAPSDCRFGQLPEPMPDDRITEWERTRGMR